MSAQLVSNRFVKLSDDGKCIPLHKLDTYYKYEDVKDEPNLAILVDSPYIVLDFDNKIQFDIMLEIIADKKLLCRVMKSTRGGHVWFKRDNPLPNHVKSNTPITLEVDVRSYGKKSLVIVKKKGVWRKWLQFDTDIDHLPHWIEPIKSDAQFLMAKNGDGRNSDLFRYIITLTKAKRSRDQVKETIHIINDYIFQDRMDDAEIETITRDKAFENIRPSFFEKNVFLHDSFAEFFVNDNHVCMNAGKMYMYKDDNYISNPRGMETKMISYIPNLRKSQRAEVLDYMSLIAKQAPKKDQFKIAVANGILDLANPRLIDPTPEIFIPNRIPVIWDEHAYDQSVDYVLNSLTCNDMQLRSLIEEVIGYMLVSNVKYQKSFILLGEGANGKSTFIDMLIDFLGDGNISSLSLKELNHRFKLAEIADKLANFGDDINDDYMTDSSIFKKLVTGDKVMIEKKNQHPYAIRNTAKLLFATNNLPTAIDKSDGLIRRLIIIPFFAKFTSADKNYDPFIADKLGTETAKSYLLNIAIQGLRRLFSQNQFTEVDVVNELIAEYAQDNNNVLQFLQVHPQVEGMIAKIIYDEYKFFTVANSMYSYKIRRFNLEIKRNTNCTLEIENLGGKTVQVWRPNK